MNRFLRLRKEAWLEAFRFYGALASRDFDRAEEHLLGSVEVNLESWVLLADSAPVRALGRAAKALNERLHS